MDTHRYAFSNYKTFIQICLLLLIGNRSRGPVALHEYIISDDTKSLTFYLTSVFFT